MFPRLSIVIMTCMALSAPLFAQQADGERSRRRGMPRSRLHAIARDLASELQLTTDQEEDYWAAVETHQTRLQAQMRERRQMRELRRELRDAKEAGDEATVAELEERVAATPREPRMRRRPGAVFAPFFDEIKPMLAEDQLERLDAFQTRQQDRWLLGGRTSRTVEQLPQQLGFDQSQQEAFDAARAQLREEMTAQRELRMEARRMFGEIRAAENAGDTETAESLRAQVEEMRPEDPMAPLKSFFDQLEPTLTDEQRTQLAGIEERVLAPPHPTEMRRGRDGAGRRERGRRGRGQTLQTLAQAVRRLDLESTQRDSINDIVRDAMRLGREDRKSRREGNQALVQDTKTKILEVLNADQKAELERLLERDGRRERPRRRAERGAGPQDGRGPGPRDR